MKDGQSPNDRDAGTPSRDTDTVESIAFSPVSGRGSSPNESSLPVPLGLALEQLRLDGAIFFRAEFTENWGVHLSG